MNDEARRQIKDDYERDEARARQTCFFDDLPGTVQVMNTWLCESHAMCATCLKSLEKVKAPVSCNCIDYVYLGHEELLYCSMDCMEEAHPEPLDQDSEEHDA